MIEGYTVKDWKSLPVAERAALFGERLLKFGLENLTNPDDIDRLDRINNLTVNIYTGKLSPAERIIAQAEIDELRGVMLDNPDRNVGRVVFDYGWIAATHFLPELKDGIPTHKPGIEPPKSNRWYEVQRSYDPRKKKIFFQTYST